MGAERTFAVVFLIFYFPAKSRFRIPVPAFFVSVSREGGKGTIDNVGSSSVNARSCRNVNQQHISRHAQLLVLT